MREDIKLLKDQDIHSYCICYKYIDDVYAETHFEFTAWVEDQLLNFKAIPNGKNRYDLYFRKDKIRTRVHISEFGVKISRLKKKDLFRNMQSIFSLRGR